MSAPIVAQSLEPGEVRRVLSEVEECALTSLTRYLDAKLKTHDPSWRRQLDAEPDLAAVLKFFVESPPATRTRLLPERGRPGGRHHLARSLVSICLEHRNRIAHAPEGLRSRPQFVAEVAADFCRLLRNLGWERDAQPFEDHAAAIHRLLYAQPVVTDLSTPPTQPVDPTGQELRDQLQSLLEEALAARDVQQPRVGEHASDQVQELYDEFRTLSAELGRWTQEQEARWQAHEDLLLSRLARPNGENGGAAVEQPVPIEPQADPDPVMAEPPRPASSSSATEEDPVSTAPVPGHAPDSPGEPVNVPEPETHEPPRPAADTGRIRAPDRPTRQRTGPLPARPGDRWPHGAGQHSYSLRARERDVRDYANDRWLSDVVGTSTARVVADRLLQHRPEGGTIRVDDDGDVSTQRKSGGGRFYLGRVSPQEWFAEVFTETEPAAAVPEAGTRFEPGLQELVADILHQLRSIGASSTSTTASSPAGPLPARPGDRWPHGAGQHSYSLRARERDVRDYANDRWLSDVVGTSTARVVADRLLQHRPEGGTIRVDDDGDVSTQRKSGGGRFYLGRVSPQEWFAEVFTDAAAEVEDLLAPGAPWPYVPGSRSYSLHKASPDVSQHSSGLRLSQVRGRATAERVAQRLLRHRPRGGVIRVDDDGDVCTRPGPGASYVYLGRVRAVEWFPGDLS